MVHCIFSNRKSYLLLLRLICVVSPRVACWNVSRPRIFCLLSLKVISQFTNSTLNRNLFIITGEQTKIINLQHCYFCKTYLWSSLFWKYGECLTLKLDDMFVEFSQFVSYDSYFYFSFELRDLFLFKIETSATGRKRANWKVEKQKWSSGEM